MVTLHELSQEVAKIREAVNSLEVKGRQNAALVVYCCEKCDNIIKAVNEAAASISAANKKDETHRDNQPIENVPDPEEGENQ